MKIFRIFYILFAFLLFCAFPVGAQISEGGTPVSFNKLSLSAVESVVTGPVDTEALLAEDEIEREQGLPFRFGAPFDVNYNVYNSGTWDELPDGGRLWRLRITSPGAIAINLIYDVFYMPPGGQMFVYSEDKKMVIGAFTERNNLDNGQFATAPVKGDVCIVEYYEPADVRGRGVIAVSRIVHAYKNVFNYGSSKSGGFGSSGTCNNNINCPEGEPWQKEKRAVGMIITSGGTRWCTGFLVNNVRKDGTPYFLTANHCLGSVGTSWTTWIIWFNYESPTCENIDGPTNYSITGTTLVARSDISDFGLVQLSATPPESYGVYYVGWSNLDTASQSSVAIHHPSGDIKKISFDYDPVTSADYLLTTGTTHWRIGVWDDGTTEGGSSGCPLFDPYHRVVGQLHGGYASCTSLTSDWFGKFSTSWNGGGTPATRLKDWLDPDNTGVTILNGWDPYGGASIMHIPLTDTRDTINDYAVICIITSKNALVPELLKLHYQIDAGWSEYQLQPTGNIDEYRGYIPAQPAGTSINYYLTAEDSEGIADTTLQYNFMVEYSAAISVSPMALSATLEAYDSTTRELVIENAGNGALDYSIDARQVFILSPQIESLLVTGAMEPAQRVYPDEYGSYAADKGADDTRDGFVVEKDAGGPDDFGYVWIDSDQPGGPTYSWVDISTVGDSALLSDDYFSGPLPLGFNFPYYGVDYSQVYIGSNGFLTFGAGSGDRMNTVIPSDGEPNNIIAMFWDDLYPPGGGKVYYYHDVVEGRFIVSFEGIPFYFSPSGTGSLTFQVILYPDGRIVMQYAAMDPGSAVDGLEGATIGIENASGTDGLEVVFNAAYVHDELAIEYFTLYRWLHLDTNVGSIPPGESDTVLCRFTTAELDTGTYTANITITSNDPDPIDNPLTIPVELTVTPLIYICGDANDDGLVNVGDAVFLISYIFREGVAPDPVCVGDTNNDGLTNVGDAVYLVNYVFREGQPPIEPCCP